MRVIDLVVDGEEQKVAIRSGEVVEGHDISGIRLQITRPDDISQVVTSRFKWRFHTGLKEEDWSHWRYTFFSPTEKISDIDEDAPTIAQVLKAARGKAVSGKPPYGELWKLFGPKESQK